MTKASLLIGLVVTFATFAISAVPAFAVFEAKKETDKGSGEVVEVTVEAGGAVISCQAFDEGQSAGEWTVEEGGKAAAKGHQLQIKITKWGECKVTKPISGGVKIGECGFEVEQSEEQAELVAKVTKACTIEGPFGCVAKIGTANNKALKSFDVGSAGESPSNTLVVSEITNLATEVNGACETAGIKHTETGKLFAVGELYSVQVRTPGLKFKQNGSGNFNSTGAANSTSKQDFFFGANSQTVFKCSEAKFTGSVSGEQNTINVIPAYNNCSQNGIVATVTVTHCAYQYSGAIAGVQGGFVGDSQLIDSGGTCEIKLVATMGAESCNITAEKQSMAHFFNTFANETLDLKILHKLFFVPYKVNEANLCVGNPASGSNGRIEGSYKINEVKIG